METNIDKTDKERIEKEAENRFPANTDLIANIVFVNGCEYEHTIANTQLAEKDNEIENLKKEQERRSSIFLETEAYNLQCCTKSN